MMDEQIRKGLLQLCIKQSPDEFYMMTKFPEKQRHILHDTILREIAATERRIEVLNHETEQYESFLRNTEWATPAGLADLEKRYAQLAQEVDQLNKENENSEKLLINKREIDEYNKQLKYLIEQKEAALIADRNAREKRKNGENDTIKDPKEPENPDVNSYVYFILEINRFMENKGIEAAHITKKVNEYKKDFPVICKQVYDNELCENDDEDENDKDTDANIYDKDQEKDIDPNIKTDEINTTNKRSKRGRKHNKKKRANFTKDPSNVNLSNDEETKDTTMDETNTDTGVGNEGFDHTNEGPSVIVEKMEDYQEMDQDSYDNETAGDNITEQFVVIEQVDIETFNHNNTEQNTMLISEDIIEIKSIPKDNIDSSHVQDLVEKIDISNAEEQITDKQNNVQDEDLDQATDNDIKNCELLPVIKNKSCTSPFKDSDEVDEKPVIVIDQQIPEYNNSLVKVEHVPDVPVVETIVDKADTFVISEENIGVEPVEQITTAVNSEDTTEDVKFVEEIARNVNQEGMSDNLCEQVVPTQELLLLGIKMEVDDHDECPVQELIHDPLQVETESNQITEQTSDDVAPVQVKKRPGRKPGRKKIEKIQKAVNVDDNTSTVRTTRSKRRTGELLLLDDLKSDEIVSKKRATQRRNKTVSIESVIHKPTPVEAAPVTKTSSTKRKNYSPMKIQLPVATNTELKRDIKKKFSKLYQGNILTSQFQEKDSNLKNYAALHNPGRLSYTYPRHREQMIESGSALDLSASNKLESNQVVAKPHEESQKEKDFLNLSMKNNISSSPFDQLIKNEDNMNQIPMNVHLPINYYCIQPSPNSQPVPASPFNYNRNLYYRPNQPARPLPTYSIASSNTQPTTPIPNMNMNNSNLYLPSTPIYAPQAAFNRITTYPVVKSPPYYFNMASCRSGVLQMQTNKETPPPQ